MNETEVISRLLFDKNPPIVIRHVDMINYRATYSSELMEQTGGGMLYRQYWKTHEFLISKPDKSIRGNNVIFEDDKGEFFQVGYYSNYYETETHVSIKVRTSFGVI